ncbi:dihydrofolate reductase family protein [Citricoccus sp.]|uniref:dihydrofolate reductase family protein n=1 Tax=Citricoccus sp. TaxID=1978372 RepID=UPI0028BED33C|nr:dihydrofolate reductase family protein [Citricoccus sp.]
MGQLGYFSIGSLDGFIADPSGDFSWAEPDEEVHQYANDQLLGVDLHLYGRRTYDLMTVWETDPSFAAANRLYAEFAERWVDADKIVYSSTLEEPVTRRTRLERTFDPDAVRALKDSTPGDLMIAGPTLAAHALRAGLVEVVDQVLLPIVIGGGLPMYPPGLRLHLELLDERRFAGGAVVVRHRVVRPAPPS